MNEATSGPAIKPISADSHVTEPPDCYTARIDPKFRGRAPHVVHDAIKGDQYIIEGMPRAVTMGTIASAGKNPKDIKVSGSTYADFHLGGWDPKARIADQDIDGIAAEIVYPTVGMMICNHPDFDYKHACFQAYNLWLQEFCAGAPNRLFGIGQTAVRSVADAIQDFRLIKEAGFKGVMLPGDPPIHDYDHPIYDPLWNAAVALGLPISFHVLTSKADSAERTLSSPVRGAKLNGPQTIIRACQDLTGLFIFGGVFDRHPGLKMVIVEADAGWAPHYMYRMDHAYERFGHMLDGHTLNRLPSDYFKENIYMTFGDDWVAFRTAQLGNPRRLMWASDFPHADATWPNSQALIAAHTTDSTEEELRWILRDNVSELYDLPCGGMIEPAP